MTTETGAAAAQMAEQKTPEHWTLDKKVPIAIIFALILQAIGAGWWAAAMEGRVAEAQRSIIRLEARDGETREGRERLIRLEERMISAAEELRRMNGKLEQLIDDRRPARAQ